MPIPLRQLQAFHAVIATGTMTKAGEMLNISQPAISRLVNSLEKNFGFPLFERLSGRLRPTSEARFLFDEVEQALTSLEHISRLTKNIQDQKAGHLRVACLPGFATSLLPRVLAQFLKERPGLTLTMEPRAPDRIHEWISSRQFDVGISEIFEENPAIESEALYVRTVCVVADDHPLAGRDRVTPTDLDGLPLIHNNRQHGVYRDLHAAFHSAGATMHGVVESRQFASACAMVTEGFGVSVVSEIDAREYENKGLVIIPFEPTIRFQINILYPAHMPRSIATREFVDTFKQSLAPFLLDPPPNR